MTEERPEQVDETTFDESEETEDEALELSPEDRVIHTAQADPQIDALYGKWQRGKLILDPDFQRHFVWDAAKCSRLMESAMLEIPLPVIYLAEEDGRELVIDGQQRLRAFFSFIEGHYPDGRESKLTGLQALTDLNGKRFSELPDPLQDRIRYCQIRAITFKPGSYAGLKFEVFRRLNTGAVSLNDQELRNCIFRGPYNELLKELSENADFRHIAGLKGPDRRMRDVQRVLRFAAFYHSTYLNYRPPMRAFLNRDMEEHQQISSQDAQKLQEAFKVAVTTIRSLLDTHAFKRFYPGTANKRDGYWEPRRFNASLYDILMYSLARESRNTVYRHLDSIREALIDLMSTDQDFIDSIELSTSSVQAVTKRFDKWRARLQDILGVAQSETRCFSHSLKQEMYDSDPTCQICHQAIRGIDDAAVDHVEQYWLGGKTIPENARLAHRYCNMARPRHD